MTFSCGDRIRIYANKEAMYFFDRETGDLMELDENERKLGRRNGINRVLNIYKNTLLNKQQKTSLEPAMLTFTIETTSSCNLQCVYCYQRDKGSRAEMSDSTADKTCDFIERCAALRGNCGINLNLIGGEPLLGMHVIRRIMSRLNESIGGGVFVHVDTNGCLPLRELSELCEHLEVIICLSLPNDHNKYRYSAGHDTTRRIINNIKNADWSGDRHVELRYNTHDGNVDDFSQFLDWIDDLRNNPVESVIPEKLDNYNYNVNFYNAMTDVQFGHWVGSKALDELLLRGWPVEIKLSTPLYALCQGHQFFSSKIYADGAVTICDAMLRNEARCNINDIYNDPNKINQIYSDIKSVDPLNCADCQLCVGLSACGGRKWCYHGGCDTLSVEKQKTTIDTVVWHHLKALPVES